MTSENDKNYIDWLLRIRRDLREKVREEANANQRTAPQQIEYILRERYKMPALEGGDSGEARSQVKTGKAKPAQPRPRQTPKRAVS